MSNKILVINGHGTKKKEKIQINKRYSLVTPGSAEDSYVLSFVDQERHLEEMTSQGKIWPITRDGQPIEWQHYQQISLHDIDISPLQHHFTLKRFATDVLDKKTRWEKLTNPSHDVLARGALAVRLSPSKITILEGQELVTYFSKLKDGQPVEGTPIFYCDKELGKIKPLGHTTLSEIYQAVGLIDEFKATGAAIVVATCSPDATHAKSIMVQTENASLSFNSVAPVKNRATPYTLLANRTWQPAYSSKSCLV